MPGRQPTLRLPAIFVAKQNPALRTQGMDTPESKTLLTEGVVAQAEDKAFRRGFRSGVNYVFRALGLLRPREVELPNRQQGGRYDGDRPEVNPDTVTLDDHSEERLNRIKNEYLALLSPPFFGDLEAIERAANFDPKTAQRVALSEPLSKPSDHDWTPQELRQRAEDCGLLAVICALLEPAGPGRSVAEHRAALTNLGLIAERMGPPEHPNLPLQQRERVALQAIVGMLLGAKQPAKLERATEEGQ